MRRLRRVALALGVGAVLASVLRLRGRGGRPPSDGGWRELDVTQPQPGKTAAAPVETPAPGADATA